MSQALIDSNDFSNALFFESAVRPWSPFTLYPHLHVWSWQQILFKNFEIKEFVKILRKLFAYWKAVMTKCESLGFTIFLSVKIVQRPDFTILISIKHARPALLCPASFRAVDLKEYPTNLRNQNRHLIGNLCYPTLIPFQNSKHKNSETYFIEKSKEILNNLVD